jgi:hypothetical protein
MPSAGSEPAIPATKRPHTYALDRAATGIGCITVSHKNINICIVNFDIKRRYMFQSQT